MNSMSDAVLHPQAAAASPPSTPHGLTHKMQLAAEEKTLAPFFLICSSLQTSFPSLKIPSKARANISVIQNASTKPLFCYWFVLNHLEKTILRGRRHWPCLLYLNDKQEGASPRLPER